jgi:DNA-directed RNA polymerase subunit RPC12/RpoP
MTQNQLKCPNCRKNGLWLHSFGPKDVATNAFVKKKENYKCKHCGHILHKKDGKELGLVYFTE